MASLNATRGSGMHTLQLTVYVDEDLQEYLIAELADLDFDAFEQTDHTVKAYAPASVWNDTKRERMEHWLMTHGRTPRIEEALLEPKNWNRDWEASLAPIAVGPFVITPPWMTVAPEHAESIVLEIVPKMSFGTGYHESTRLVLRALDAYTPHGGRVLDAGTGTGILAIAALKLGAAEAIAFDIDAWSQQNAVENFEQNGVGAAVDFRPGSIDVVPERGFDLILANINRNVLEELLPAFKLKLAPGGFLILAGLLRRDREPMLALAERTGLALADEAYENDWWSAVLCHA